jgi:hypothetical protein
MIIHTNDFSLHLGIPHPGDYFLPEHFRMDCQWFGDFSNMSFKAGLNLRPHHLYRHSGWYKILLKIFIGAEHEMHITYSTSRWLNAYLFKIDIEQGLLKILSGALF